MIEKNNDQFFLIVPRVAFITVFSKSFLNRQAQASHVVKTSIFKEEIVIEITSLIDNLFNLTRSENPFYIFYIAKSEKYFTDFNPNIPRDYNYYNIYFRFYDIKKFSESFRPLKTSEFPIVDRAIYIFCDFENWHTILLSIFNNSSIDNEGGIVLNGGDSSKRHVIDMLSIKLNIYLLALSGINLEFISKNLLFNIDKKYLIPQFDFHKYTIQPSKGINLDKIATITKRQDKLKSIKNETDFNNIKQTKIENKNENNDSESSENDEYSCNTYNSVNKIKNSPLDNSLNSLNKKRNYHSLSINRIKFKSLLFINLTYKQYSTNTIKNRITKVNDIKLGLYLTKVKDLLNTLNISNSKDIQQSIEDNWLNFAKDSFTVEREVKFKSQSIYKNAYDVLLFYDKKSYFKNNFGVLHKDIVQYKNVIIAFSVILVMYKRFSQTYISSTISNKIILNLFFYDYKDKFDTITEFEDHFNLSSLLKVKLGEIFIMIFSTQNEQPIIETYFDYDENENRIKFNSDYVEYLKEFMVINPQSLPMVTTPNKWDTKNYGGFLNNKIEKKNLIRGSEQHNHKLELGSIIYDSINFLNKQKFSVNYKLLDYIKTTDGNKILSIFYKEEASYINQLISLEIAETYRNIPFYLNCMIDWRGRIYTQSFYLDYQGSEFSLALVNLNEGKSLTSKGKEYFYIYGANCYNYNNINKKSFQHRINWVYSNMENILKMDIDFILKAESPTLFAAFCLEMKELSIDSEYLIKMPVFLDATCSGIQHFAGMLLDEDLARNVNLSYSKDEVNDLYTKLISPINEQINLYGIKNYVTEFTELSITRELLKFIVMTKCYNVSVYGIYKRLVKKLENIKIPIKKVSSNLNKNKDFSYIKENISLEKVNKNIKHKNLYKFPSTNIKGFTLLDDKRLFELSKVISDNVFSYFPSINKIYHFLNRWAILMLKLNLPIKWVTPLGLELTQEYNKSKINNLTINFLGRRRHIILRDWISEKDNKKNIQAILPNIIHSFDAAHLIKIIENWNLTYKSKYLLPIHDCFGTHPNDLEQLSEVIRKEFISIYCSDSFIKSLHKNIINDIKIYNLPIVKKNKKSYVEIIIKNKNILLEIPDLVKQGKLRPKDILKSKYMIN